MERIPGFKLTWRVTGLALFCLALVLPWTYDVIHVPAEFACSPPNVRLEGDFCGLPLPGGMVVFFLLQGLVGAMLAGLVNGSSAANSREILFLTVSLFLVLPAASTALAIWRKDARDTGVLQAAAWGLALVPASLFIAFSFSSGSQIPLSGSWVFTGTALGSCILESLALAVEKRASRGR